MDTQRSFRYVIVILPLVMVAAGCSWHPGNILSKNPKDSVNSAAIGESYPKINDASSKFDSNAGMRSIPSALVKQTTPKIQQTSYDDIFPLSEEEDSEDEVSSVLIEAEFEDEPLESVLFTLLFGSGEFEIMGDPDVSISASIAAMTESEAILQLMDQTNILISQQGSQFVVYSSEAKEALGDRDITFIYQCRRAKAPDLIGVLEGKAPEGFPTSGSPFNNQVNVPEQGVVTQSQVVSEEGLKNPLGDVEYQVVHHMNGIVLVGSIEEIKRAVAFLKLLDKPIPIVVVELLIVQYVHENGFNWRYNLNNGQIARADPPEFGTTGAAVVPGTASNKFGDTDWGVNFQEVGFNAATGGGPLAFSAIGSLTGAFRQNLQYLVTEDMARVVTNPHVAVVNGHKGTIMLNERFNFFSNIVQPITGTVEQEKQELNNVTALVVTPTIVGPNRIHLAVNATVSAFIGSLTGAAAADLPDQRSSDIGTSVVMGDNQTLIIGGLIREEINEGNDRIPYASRLPLVGNLFRGRDESQRFTETVVYITPHLERSDILEDDHVKDVFKQTERLKDRKEEIRDRHRTDRYESWQMRRTNEQLDRCIEDEHKAQKKAERRAPRQVRRWDRNIGRNSVCPPEMTFSNAGPGTNADESDSPDDDYGSPESIPPESDEEIAPQDFDSILQPIQSSVSGFNKPRVTLELPSPTGG